MTEYHQQKVYFDKRCQVGPPSTGLDINSLQINPASTSGIRNLKISDTSHQQTNDYRELRMENMVVLDARTSEGVVSTVHNLRLLLSHSSASLTSRGRRCILKVLDNDFARCAQSKNNRYGVEVWAFLIAFNLQVLAT